MTSFHRLAFTALFLAVGSSLHGQSSSPQNPTLITGPTTISQPGFYRLANNIVSSSQSGNIITITIGNVTLDFNGFYISGPSINAPTNTNVGVYASEAGNLTIMNGLIAYCQRGIVLSGNGTGGSLNVNQTINNMFVTYCSHIGIALLRANYSNITNCRVSNISGATNVSTGNFGIYATGTGDSIDGCRVQVVSDLFNGVHGIGIGNDSISGDTRLSGFVTGCQIANAYYGINNVYKAANILTSGVTTRYQNLSNYDGYFD